MTDHQKSGHLGVHFFYVTLILTLTIIGLTTHQWTGIVDFREYLNVGTTMTSLVLAILAIIYSFVSNGLQSSVLGAVESAASTTSASATKLDSFMIAAQQLQGEATKRSSDLQLLTEKLALSVDEIRKETASLASANHEIAGQVVTLPDQLGELRGLIEKAGKADTLTPSNTKEKNWLAWDDRSISSVLRHASRFGLAIIEAAIKANEFRMFFSLTTLAKELDEENNDYFWGFLIGFSSSMLIETIAQDENGEIFSTQDVHPLLRKNLDSEWIRREEAETDTSEKAVIAKLRAASLASLTKPKTKPT